MAQHRGALGEMQRYLERSEPARERANKDRHILWIISCKHEKLDKLIKLGISDKEQKATPEDMIVFMREYALYDRCWRKILQDYKELRGKDYDDKEILEEEAMQGLGYEANQKVI